MTDLQSNAREINRLAYLDAMGVDSYVSRRDLPAAAPSRRLCIVPREAPTSPAAAVLQQSLQGQSQAGDAGAEQQRSAPPAKTAARPPAPVSPRELLGEELARPTPEPVAPVAGKPEQRSESADVPVFSLAATYVGGWYWLDDIPPGRALGPEYLQLLSAICQALKLDSAPPVQEQFNWPQGTGGQLDRGIAAAQAGLAGFLSGRIERFSPAKIILLGSLEHAWFDSAQLPAQPAQISVSAWRMLREPQLKRQAWAELKPLMADAS